MKIGDVKIGPGQPAYIIAEIGINHNGDIKNVEKLIDAAIDAGADAVKFQKRTPEICTPKDLWGYMRETPWGDMTYIDYRKKLELEWSDYEKWLKDPSVIWSKPIIDSNSLGPLFSGLK